MDEIMDYIFPYSGKTIEETLKSAHIASSTYTTQTGMVLRFDTNEGQDVLNLPVATLQNAGIVTSATMQRISVAENNIRALNTSINDKFAALPKGVSGVTLTRNMQGVNLTFVDVDGTEIFSTSLPTATEEYAGLVTAAEKKLLESVQITYKAQKVRNPILQQGLPDASAEGELCFDTSRKILLLLYGGNYYQNWVANNDPNGMLGSDSYKSGHAIIDVLGKMYSWTGSEWTNVGDGLIADVMTEAEFQALQSNGKLVEGVLYLTY